jgi:hypothetical protein
MQVDKYQVFNLWESMVADCDMKKQTFMDKAIEVFYNGVTSDFINCYLLNLAYTFVRRYS